MLAAATMSSGADFDYLFRSASEDEESQTRCKARSDHSTYEDDVVRHCQSSFVSTLSQTRFSKDATGIKPKRRVRKAKRPSEPPTSSPGSESYVPSEDEDSPIKPTARRHAYGSSSQPSRSSQKQTVKKRKAEAEAVPEREEPKYPKRSSYYLGSILVANAWSTARGTGYVKNGDIINVEREIWNGKQRTLDNMMRLPGTSKAKANYIVRLTNSRGFGEHIYLLSEIKISTCVQNSADYLLMFLLGYRSYLTLVRLTVIVCRLLLTSFSGIIIFKGSKMLDCPEKLYTGADLLVLLSLHILPSAFRRYKAKINGDVSQDKVSYFEREGVETEEEKNLRARKASLQNLFKRLDLRPKQDEQPLHSPEGKENVHPEGAPLPSQIVCSGSRKCLGDGSGNHNHSHNHDDSDDSDAEVLSDGDLQVIYKRFECHLPSSRT